MGIYDIV